MLPLTRDDSLRLVPQRTAVVLPDELPEAQAPRGVQRDPAAVGLYFLKREVVGGCHRHRGFWSMTLRTNMGRGTMGFPRDARSLDEVLCLVLYIFVMRDEMNHVRCLGLSISMQC